MRKYLKHICIYLVVQLISWSLLTFADYMNETYDSLLLRIILFNYLPASYIVYLLLRKTIYSKCNTQKELFLSMICGIAFFMVSSIVIGFGILYMIEDDMWIIYQHQDGWNNFLNSIEYPAFGIFECILGLVISLSEVIIFVVNKIKRHFV